MANLKVDGLEPTKIASAFSNSERRLASDAASASVVASSVSARAMSSSLPIPPSNRLRTRFTCSLRRSTVPATVAISASNARNPK